MPDGAQQQTARYSAFISYSHADKVFARRLHRKLEAYKLPSRLRQTAHNTRAAAPRRLLPVFLDRIGFNAAPNLTDAIRAAIAESRFLIVICSTNCPKSDWVGLEVAQFRAIHGADSVLAALVDGTPQTAFPPALLQPDSHGQIQEPLAADFRPRADGRRLAFLKLIGVLTDVRLDELIQRDAQRRIEQITAIGTGAVLGMAVMAVLTLVAVHARRAAEAAQSRGDALIGFMLNELHDQLDTLVPLNLLDELHRKELDYFRGQDLRRMTVAELQQRAKLLVEIGENDESEDRIADAHAQYQEALRTTTALLAAAPNDPQRIYDQGQSDYYVGNNDWSLRNPAGAQAHLQDYVDLANRLVRIDPANSDWIMEVAYADSSLGTFVFRHLGDIQPAGRLFSAAQQAFHQIARLHDGAAIQQQIEDGLAWLGDVARLSGDYPNAIADRTEQRQMLDRLLAQAPRNTRFRRDLIANQLAFARIDIARGNLPAALVELAKGYADALELRREDASDYRPTRQMRIYELFEAQALLLMATGPTGQDSRIGGLVDCSQDLARPNNDELATFCLILGAAYFAHLADSARSADALAQARTRIAVMQDKLTEFYGLDFPAEIARMHLPPATAKPVKP